MNVVLSTVARASFGLVTVQVAVLLVVLDADPPVAPPPGHAMSLELPSGEYRSGWFFRASHSIGAWR